MNDLVSIIVPAFNAGKVIERCISSIVCQDYGNKEIIIVNDGSSDDTEEICKKLAGIHREISLYNIQNKGVSNARNEGLSHVRGKWILFVDADDELEGECLKTSISTLRDKEADTICFNSFYVDNEHVITPMRPIIPEKIFDTAEERNALIESLYIENTDGYTGDYFRAVWGKIFSADLIKNNKLCFPESVQIGEDAIFLIQYIHHTSRIYICNKYLCRYHRMEESVTRKYKADFYKMQLQEFTTAGETLRQYGLDHRRILENYWHEGERIFIENELKSNERFWGRVKRIAGYLMERELRLYLPEYRGKKLRPRIRGMLEKHGCYYLLALIDYSISKWKHG